MFHVKHETWPAIDDPPLTAGQVAALESFERLLADRAVSLGMIARSDLGRLRERHVLDSLRGAACMPAGARRILDLGSGAGLPGVPVAIAIPDARVTLAERRRNRAAFLEFVVDELSLDNVLVHAGDATDLAGPFDACLARAFGDAEEAWRMALPRLSPGGVLLYWAGRSFDPGRGAPEGALVTLFEPPPLANVGPIAIMTQQ